MQIKIAELIKHNSLIWSNQPDIVVDQNSLNIFLGGGIATKTQISQAVPFDLVGFMLTAEQLRRTTRGHVHMLIADQHAWLANNLNQTQATRAANRLFDMTTHIIHNFGFANWHTHLASQIFPNAVIASYEALESHDITHFVDHHQVGIKLGWTFSPKEKGITDEAHFDQLHSLPTILIKPGLTNDPNKPHESPYICTNPSQRITLDKPINWDISLRVQNHLRNICSLFESIIQPFPAKTPLSTKIQQIIQIIVK